MDFCHALMVKVGRLGVVLSMAAGGVAVSPAVARTSPRSMRAAAMPSTGGTTSSSSMSSTPAPSGRVVAWLDRIEQAANHVQTLHARITYVRVQGLLGDEQRRFGTLVYQAAQPAAAKGGNDKNEGDHGEGESDGTPAKFAIRFDRIVLDNQLQEQDRSYVFDGQWLAEKHGDDKTFIRRQLVPDEKVGANLFELGEGPFVLPFNLKRAKVLERFKVRLIPPKPPKAEPKPHKTSSTVHFALTPRAHVKLDQKRIDLWFDRNTLLPVRVRTVDSDQSRSIIMLRKQKVNAPVKAGVFDTTPPRGSNWQVEVKPLPSSRSPS